MGNNLCHNCHNTFAGNFCSNCGQKDIGNKRLNFHDLVKDFFDNVFNLHKGLFYTFWELIIRPGKVGMAYISGQRKSFTNPVRYLIIAVAFQAFIDYWILNPEIIAIPDFIAFPFLSDQMNESMAIWNYTLAVKYSLIHNLTMILVFPLAFMVLFRGLKYNFVELLVVNFYYFSTGLILTVLTIFLYYIFWGSELPIPVIIIITFLYVIWTGMDFFKKEKVWIRFLKVMTAVAFFMLLRVFFMLFILSMFFPITEV